MDRKTKNQLDIDLTASGDCCKHNRLDLIYRQDAIDAVIKRDANCGIDSAEVLKALPSAEPERKRGRWIVHYECPKCGEITKDFTEYCPFCNADMRGEQDEHID